MVLTLLLSLISIILGLGAGFILPDIEAIIAAFFVEPHHQVSQMIQSYYKERKFKLLWFYWRQNRREYQSLIVHSAFFQIVFFVFSLYIATSEGSSFATALCLGFLGHLFYDQYLDFKKGKLASWFWALKFPLTKNFYRVYFGLLGIGTVYIATLLL